MWIRGFKYTVVPHHPCMMQVSTPVRPISLSLRLHLGYGGRTKCSRYFNRRSNREGIAVTHLLGFGMHPIEVPSHYDLTF